MVCSELLFPLPLILWPQGDLLAREMGGFLLVEILRRQVAAEIPHDSLQDGKELAGS